MGISLVRQEVTGVEPITLAEMKQHLRVDFTDDDDLISSLITAAREHAETVTGRSLVTSIWVYGLEAFPYNWQLQTAPARSTINRFAGWWADAQVIRIPQAPLKAIASIRYIPSGGGAYVTLDPSLYVVDTSSNPAVIYPAANQYWPYTWIQHNSVLITFTSGYSEVPEVIKTAIKLLVCYWYENRGDDQSKAPQVFSTLLKSYRSQPCGYVGV